ncbi:MAG: Methionine aminopeptidase [Candidatus Magasanikbacteria bacterium GW2011_GWA2_56_11]|uniref:Methionine aminopeptidase n=1 Tax=Candidatus Magasanikbacteria bacterium GW2011_GWA2_56_11 TaxID=1619044 RepID=A0A0G1YGD1_9BACT|nr:MAG: Methionine aminopeptidase [Candidatus Magasanikbacteria bacterium GW2011_GWA2_56_11]
MYVKKPHEIELIIEGGRLMGDVLDRLSGMIKPGVSAWEIDQAAEAMIRAAGGAPAFKGYRGRKSDPPFPSTLCFSVNEELVHGIATKEKIVKDGDLVSLDIGMEYPAGQNSKAKNQKSGRGYFTDTALTVAVGKVPEKIQKLLRVTEQALEAGIEASRPGRTVADIGRAIEQYVYQQGRYGIVRDLVGHGVGHAVHEEPRVPNYYDEDLETWILRPGVVIAIEPMISLGSYQVKVARDGWTISTADQSLNAHFEHTIVITEDGPLVATRRPSERP